MNTHPPGGLKSKISHMVLRHQHQLLLFTSQGSRLDGEVAAISDAAAQLRLLRCLERLRYHVSSLQKGSL